MDMVLLMFLFGIPAALYYTILLFRECHALGVHEIPAKVMATSNLVRKYALWIQAARMMPELRADFYPFSFLGLMASMAIGGICHSGYLSSTLTDSMGTVTTIAIILNLVVFLFSCVAFGIFTFGVAAVSTLSFGAILARIPPPGQDPNSK